MGKNGRLKISRERSGLTQEDLAEKMGVSQSYIGSLEKNKEFSVKKAKEIALILGIDWKWLYYGDNSDIQDTVPNNVKEAEVEYLRSILEQKDKMLLDKERTISDKEEIIQLLKEKLDSKSKDNIKSNAGAVPGKLKQ